MGRGFEPPDRLATVNRLAICRIKPALPPHQKRESKEKTSDVPLREVKIRNTAIVVKETSLIIYFCYYIFDNI